MTLERGTQKPDSWTRKQILEERGYPAEIVAGVNHDPDVLANGHLHSTTPEQTAPPPAAPACVVCSKPIPPARARQNAKTCGEGCATEQLRRRRQANDARRRGGPKMPAPVRKAASRTPVPDGTASAAPEAGTGRPDGLAEVVRRLVGAGLQVSVEVAGIRLEVR